MVDWGCNFRKYVLFCIVYVDTVIYVYIHVYNSLHIGWPSVGICIHMIQRLVLHVCTHMFNMALARHTWNML